MIVKVFTLRDKKVEVFGLPFCAQNEKAAQRMVQQSMEMTNSQIGRYPEDFDVYEIAEFDDNNGQINHDVHHPHFVCSAVSLVRRIHNDADVIVDNPEDRQ